MSAEDNKAIVQRLNDEVLNRGNLEVIDQLIADTYVSTPLWPDPRTPSAITATDDRQMLRQGNIMVRTALPDVTTTIEAMTAEGDTVIVCSTTRGTHTGGDFFDIPPTGKQLQWTTFSIFRLANGKIVEQRWLWDRLGVWQQLGVLPGQDALQQQRSHA